MKTTLFLLWEIFNKEGKILEDIKEKQGKQEKCFNYHFKNLSFIWLI